MRPILKALSIVAILTWISIGASTAQEPVAKERSPEEIAQQQTKKLTKELSLSDEQQKAVYDINLKHAQKNTELRKSLREAKKDFDQRDEDLKTVLNDDQKQKLTTLRANQKAKMKQARMTRHNAAQPTE